ncbi:hypothetical protein [Flavobacterium oreochromis]|uniref:Uncharacterized protein n=1 Tax=Flavobacterium oreochromis TaxID=2906078 RepID=A0ABW8P585_9FLAO|nr:hypothetical protein [Flavobacterium oreochromis]OWP79072.1 hypothetical protein BWG23_00620 [Flavobacterium oreochromis]POR30663.1 hypothetical protein BWK58_00625 [Flavobacterium columnare]QYS87265.1 hypothetical protein JJC03_04870 [Flavobacterium oreochromis]
MKLIPLILSCLLFTFLHSCQDKQTSKLQTQNNQKQTNKLKVNAKLFSDLLEFISYNDDGDYMLINFKKGNDTLTFVNENNEDRSLLRGDMAQVQWIKDTIYIAGDGETPEIADWLVGFKKTKDGNLSKFKKTYKKEIKYHWFNENEYSQDYLDALYVLVEYYIANSKNELLKIHLKENSALEYSIEQQERDGKKFTVLGLGTSFEGRMTKIQWLYYEAEKNLLYEYDLGNDRLMLFK